MSVEILEKPEVLSAEVLETKVSMLENKKTKSGPMIDQEKVKTLDPLAKAIWQKIAPRDGTLALYGDVGESKSATFTSLCQHLGIKYIRKDLATMDESDLSGIPNKKVSKTGLSYVENLLPQYIVDAIESDVPVLIVFEEVNRCNPYTRAASLGVINEKIVSNVLLPDHVYIAAALNIGDAYEAEIEDIGLAMKNRFIWMKFEMSVSSWFNRFAKDNVHPYVVKFLEAYPQQAKFTTRGSALKGDELSFETLRTWTFLSSHLKQFETLEEVIGAVQGFRMSTGGMNEFYGGAECYVGSSAKVAFLNFLETMKSIKPSDIIDNLPAFESVIAGMSSPERLQLLEHFKGTSASHYDLNNLSRKQYNNLKTFMLKFIDTDVLIGFIDEVTRMLSKGLANPLEMKKLGFIKFLREPEFRELNNQMINVYKSSSGKNMIN